MLVVRFESGERLGEIYKALGVAAEPEGSNFVMFEVHAIPEGDADVGAAVALWRMRVSADGRGDIELIRFKDGLDEGDKLFFLHAIMFKLREGSPILLETREYGDLLERFGFERDDDGCFRLYSGEINLYYNCGGQYGRFDKKLH